jgi:hypothetical protein
MQYGFENGHLKIEDLDFHDSVQGAIYDLTVDSARQRKVQVPEFVVYDTTIKGIIYVAENEAVNKWTTYMEPYRYPVHTVSLDCIKGLVPHQQKLVNNGYIQLLGGCNVKILHRVWFG